MNALRYEVVCVESDQLKLRNEVVVAGKNEIKGLKTY